MTQTNKSFWFFITPLFLMTFFVFGEHLIVVPLSASISKSTGLPLVKAGLLVAIYPLAAAFSAFLTAPFSDRLGRKAMIIILSLGFCLSTFGFANAKTVFTVLLFRVLCGICGGPVFACILAFIGDKFQGNERVRAITAMMLTFSTASILAVPMGSWLGDTFGWRMPFYLISVMVLVCCIMISQMKAIPTGAETGKILHQYLELIQLFNLAKVRKVFTLQFFMIIGLFGFVPNVSVWLNLNYGFDATQIGLCYMQGGIGGLIGNSIAGFFLQRGFKDRLIIIGSMIMAGFLILATREILPPIYVGSFFAGLMFGGSIRMPALQVILTELIPINLRGRFMSMSMIVSNLTMGLGGIWSIQILKVEAGRLEGMPLVGILGGASLMFVPYLVYLVRKELDKAEKY
jgi:predicted MFS family arabinose efflux permease